MYTPNLQSERDFRLSTNAVGIALSEENAKGFARSVDKISMRKKITILSLILAACCVALTMRVHSVRQDTWQKQLTVGGHRATLDAQGQAMDILTTLAASAACLSIVIWPVGAAYRSIFRWHVVVIKQALDNPKNQS